MNSSQPVNDTWKETTLGKIPSNWHVMTSDEFCVKVADGTHDTPKPSDNGKFLVTSKHIKNGAVDLTSAYKISDADFADINRRSKVDKWDVLLSMIGTVGEICLIDHEPDFAIKNVGLFKCGEEFKAKWLFYYLRSKIGQYEIQKRMSGTTQAYVTLGSLRSLPVVVPNLESEQKAIAGVLSSLDDKIDLLWRQNKTLENIAQAIFKEWFVHFTINGQKLKLNPITNLPNGWKMGKLADEFQIVMGQSPSGESYNELGDGLIFFQGRAEFQDRFPAIRLYTTEPKRFAEKFDVLVSVRAPVGDINVAFDRCCIGRGLAAVRSRYKSYALYKIKSLQDAFNKFEAEGTVFGSINKDAFAGIEAIIPDEQSVKLFEATAKPIDTKIFNNHNQIHTLSKLRDSLLPKLMKGEIRITVQY